MADRRDDLDSWLDGRIEPLPPPPGTFGLIKRRARRRKYRRLAITAGAAAVIVAAAVTVPQVVNLPVLNPTTATGAANAAASGHSSPAAPAVSAGTSSSLASAAGSPAPALVPVPVPGRFEPTSATFIGTDTGWVIGQAGTPGRCATAYCTSVARTDDAGKTWSGVPAPLAGPADGAAGVSQIRFLNGADGWAFGPELFATHDGGRTWTRLGTTGLRVTEVETVADRAFGLFASCTGSGTAFAARCTSYTLYSSPAGADDWTPVGASTSGLKAGSAGAASLVLTGTRGLPAGAGRDAVRRAGGRQRAVAAGHDRSRARSGRRWPAASRPVRCSPRRTRRTWCWPARRQAPRGRPDQEHLHLGRRRDQLAERGAGPALGLATSVAASPAGAYLLATGQGLDVRPAGSATWQASGAGRPGAQGRVRLRGHDDRRAGHRAAREPRGRHDLVHLRRRAELASVHGERSLAAA